MKNWVNNIISLTCLLVLSLSQGRYYFNALSNELEANAGVYVVEPEGFIDPYFHYSKLISHFIEFVFSVFIFGVAHRVEKRGFIALVLSLILIGGTVNQYVDRAFFDPYTEGKNEMIGFYLTLIGSVVLSLIWRHRTITTD